jgi:hypothetical protein
MDKNFINYIHDYQKKKYKCCLCGKTKNVKYEIAIHEDNTIKHLPCCSVCTLYYLQYFNDAEAPQQS